MCSYMDVFSPRLPHYFIQKFTRRGDVVLDPFCGRGATPLQACVEGRVGIGMDPASLAYALTRAKVKPLDPILLQNRMDDLSNDMFFCEVSNQPAAIRLLFHDYTLSQLVFLKQTLDPADQTDAFIVGALLGMLHGNARGSKGAGKTPRLNAAPSFLSIPIPGMFRVSADHIERYIREKNLAAPRLDVFACLRARVDRLLRLGSPQTEGRVWNARIQEMRDLPDPALKRKKVRLVFTSPPSLKAPKHGLADWVRLWFLGEDPNKLDERPDRRRKLEDYLAFMWNTCRLLYHVTAPGGVCALAIGDARKGKSEPVRLAEEVWTHLKRKHTRWQLADILEDAPPDRILVLYKNEYEEVRERVPW